MSNSIQTNENASVRILGIGGGACRVLERLRQQCPPEVKTLAVDTDVRELDRCVGVDPLRIGRSLLRGLGCGGDVAMGRTAAESDRAAISAQLEGADLLIVIACLGRGCGSGAAPILAGLAGEAGCPTVVIASEPFEFEGSGPAKVAREAIVALRKISDCVITLPNNLLFQVSNDEDRADRLFEASDGWMLQAIHALTGPIFRPSRLPADLATFRKAIQGGESRAHFSTCRVPISGGVEAIRKGIFDCPLRSSGLERLRAERLLISCGSGGNMRVSQFGEITRGVADLFECRNEATVALWEDEALGEDIEVTVIARSSLESQPAASVSRGKTVEVHTSKLKKRDQRKGAASSQQTEFDTLLEHNERGLFGRMEVDAYDGVDLDKPTFLRRGIKISMPKG